MNPILRLSLPLSVLAVAIVVGFSQPYYPLFTQGVERFEVPEGFAVEEVYSPDESGSIWTITFDSQGRLVFARQQGEIVTLVEQEDGSFTEHVYTEEVHSSQGIFFDGHDMLATGIGPDSLVGLWRVTDTTGDGYGDEVELIEELFGSIEEHGPHHPFFGPDGYLYITHGNATGVMSRHSLQSPLRRYSDGVLLGREDPRGHARNWRAPGGAFIRKNLEKPDSEWELVTAGFRNQYDGAFNMMGELFTFDSDMEWDRDLPWFRPIRSVHAVPGGDYGWRTGSGKFPAYYLDNLPPMEDLGRGSPTGTVFYQAYSYPEEYWDAFLQADWSRGRIVLGHPRKDGATYSQVAAADGECPDPHRECETVNIVYGQPLNVTGIDVGPDGNVYFALGGRGTTGGIYRIVYNGPDAMAQPETNTRIDQVLSMPQPRSAWSREMARSIKQEMGETGWRGALSAEAQNPQADPERRVRAIELLQVFGPGLDEDFLMSLAGDPSWDVRAASVYYLGMHRSDSVRHELIRHLQDADPFVQRRALEALLRTGIHPGEESPLSAVDDIFPLLASEDRYVRHAARSVLREINPNKWQQAALEADTYPQAPEALMAYVETLHSPSLIHLNILTSRQLELLEANPSDDELLQLIRVIQRTMYEDHGIEFAAGSGVDAQYPRLGQALLDRFPSDDDRLNREIAMTLAYLEPAGAVDQLVAALQDAGDDRVQQIAYGWALSFIQSGWGEDAVEHMISWIETVHLERWRGGASFAGFINYIRDDFVRNIPETQRAIASARFEEMDELIAIDAPTAGAPATSAHGLSDEELIDHLVYQPQAYEGNPDAGAIAYEKATCAACHTFGSIGIEFGPDLTGVAQRFSRRDLIEKIIDPSANVADLWLVEEITTTDGEVISGTIYSEDSNEVVVQVAAGAQIAVTQSEIASREVSAESAMPPGLHHHLSVGELINLMAFFEAGPEAIPDSVAARW